ncbi:hypothetical protein FOZ60_010662 [Perkinsus olseni]|uniref:Uncharacterized protein n=1 Tax=Perkinsus olseni TaxID=32597 RepID=A0A7J6NFX6_PEROL|nr:hypothetical protein FOZ60_010662 [Perkinsus olseni]
MMKFVQLCLVAVQLTLVQGQDIGKYVYSSEGFNYTVNVYEGADVNIAFEVPGQPVFVDGKYRLVRDSHTQYSMDFSGSLDGVRYIYHHIGALLGGMTFNPSDLTVLTYTTADSMTVNFGGRELTLTRVGYDLQPGVFYHRISEAPRISITFRLLGEGSYEVVFSCGDTDVAYGGLWLEKAARPYKHYAVVESGRDAVNSLRAEIESTCSFEGLQDGDLSRMTFITQESIIIPFQRRRMLLEKL